MGIHSWLKLSYHVANLVEIIKCVNNWSYGEFMELVR